MRAGAHLLHLLDVHHAMAAHGHAAAGSNSKPSAAFSSPARRARGFPLRHPSSAAKRRPAPARLGDAAGAPGIGGSYLGAEAAALLACVTATLLVLPLLLPPLPPPPPLFLLVPVAIFAVLLLLVLVPSDAKGAAVTVGPTPSSAASSSYL